ncbi:hypothetical protein AMAG_14224 [Allomyces macrogynus ATCC 38327]|uniref:Triacylglycerol lipase N-terminal domain-containing protein n=1 Tax=Allomyces macrogynus (strain ATCC 38327) TaxID=578462 RepID=A0A0L0T560_ALLM3|nr:hypothetical protein AMAG_14224 [Allomyces macrogynus ATCC 38327]|eukprot:KNE69669.1 hypothetical protein AMAG_14224 [Allomyces macrogynus ATCC 38327]
MLSALSWAARLFVPAASPSDLDQLRAALDHAQSYDEWKRTAQQLDRKLGNDLWKEQPVSNDYDHKLIYYRLAKMRNDRALHHVLNLMFGLRSGLLRNLGGISDPRLYCTSYIGTKRLIQEYTREVVAPLDYIAEGSPPNLPPQPKLRFLPTRPPSRLEFRGPFPRGGPTLGAPLPPVLPGQFKAVGRPVPATCAARYTLAQVRPPLDVKVLEACVRSNVGDLTFDEAYHKTRRILNITIPSNQGPHDAPKVLNYLTAPNVLIWSAACASTAATYPLYPQVPLLAKETDGGITKWSPAGRDITWVAGSSSPTPTTATPWARVASAAAALASSTTPTAAGDPSPHHRLAELFNVNHMIVSQAGALAAPMVLRGWRERHSLVARLASAVLMEVRHRTAQAAAMGIIPGIVAAWVAPPTITGDVTITPDLAIDDYKNLFANPTEADMAYWIKKGEQSTWPLMSLIKNRCVIEFALDRNYQALRQAMADRASASQAAVAAAAAAAQQVVHVHHHGRRTTVGPGVAGPVSADRGEVAAAAAGEAQVLLRGPRNRSIY